MKHDPKDLSTDVHPPPDYWARFLSMVELWAGTGCAVIGAVLLYMWWTGRADDRHGMIFAFLAGAFVVPFGLTFLLAALGLRLLPGPIRWYAQVLPVLWPLAYVAFFKWGLLP